MSVDAAKHVDMVLERLPEILEVAPDKARRPYDVLAKQFATKKIATILSRIESILSELKNLRKDIHEEFDRMHTRLDRVEGALDKLMLDIEEDARLTIREFLGNYGIEIDIKPLVFRDGEIDIYGCLGDICVVGGASARAGTP